MQIKFDRILLTFQVFVRRYVVDLLKNIMSNCMIILVIETGIFE